MSIIKRNRGFRNHISKSLCFHFIETSFARTLFLIILQISDLHKTASAMPLYQRSSPACRSAHADPPLQGTLSHNNKPLYQDRRPWEEAVSSHFLKLCLSAACFFEQHGNLIKRRKLNTGIHTCGFYRINRIRQRLCIFNDRRNKLFSSHIDHRTSLDIERL